MRLKTTHVFILIIVGVGIAYYLIGDVALAGLLALLGFGGKDKQHTANKLITEADEHEKMADHEVHQAQQHNKVAEQVGDDMTKIVNSEPDEDITIQDLEDEAKEDWS